MQFGYFFREIILKNSGILIIFRARFTQNSGILLIFFYMFFRAKNVCAPTPRHSADEAINEQKNIKCNSKLITTNAIIQW